MDLIFIKNRLNIPFNKGNTSFIQLNIIIVQEGTAGIGNSFSHKYLLPK